MHEVQRSQVLVPKFTILTFPNKMLYLETKQNKQRERERERVLTLFCGVCFVLFFPVTALVF